MVKTVGPDVARKSGATTRVVALAGVLALAVSVVVFVMRDRLGSPQTLPRNELRQLATNLLQEARLAEARPIIESLVKDPDADANDRFLLGLLLKEEKRSAEALKVLESIPGEAPRPCSTSLAPVLQHGGAPACARSGIRQRVRPQRQVPIAHPNAARAQRATIPMTHLPRA